MRILIATPYLPWPLDAGGKYTQFTLINYLRKHHEITLMAPVKTELELSFVAELQEKWPEVLLMPIPAGGNSATGIKRTKTAARLKNVFRTRASGLFRHCRNLRHAFTARRSRPVAQDTDEFLWLEVLPKSLVEAVVHEAEKGYDLIQVDYVEFLSLITVLPRTVPCIFIHHQLHFVFHQRKYAGRLQSEPHLQYSYEWLKTQELGLLKCYDAVLTMSETDQSILQDELDGPAIYSSPTLIVEEPPLDSGHPEKRSFSGKLLYLGGESHSPNADAVKWFLQTIWPSLAAREPNVTFHVIGAWSPATMQILEKNPRVVCTGFVEDLRPLLDGGILLVPLRIGSGFRVKILQVMVEGVPVVSTKVGCEGIPVMDNQELLIADEPRDFIEATIRLIHDEKLRSRLAINAQKMVCKSYSASAIGGRRSDIYKKVTEQHRTNLLRMDSTPENVKTPTIAIVGVGAEQ